MITLSRSRRRPFDCAPRSRRRRVLPPRTRGGLVAVLVAAATLTGAPGLHAQTEVQVGGVWVHDFQRGPYVGVLQEWLIGSERVDTTWVDLGGGRRQAVPTRVGRLWTLTSWIGAGPVDGPGAKGLELGLHGQLGVTRRRPNSVVDRVGVLADVYGVRWGIGASATVRLKTAFWLDAGVVHARGSLRPAFGVRLQASLLAELGRFIF